MELFFISLIGRGWLLGRAGGGRPTLSIAVFSVPVMGCVVVVVSRVGGGTEVRLRALLIRFLCPGGPAV